IGAVLDNLKRQADARQGSMDDVMQMIDRAVVSLEQRARKEFTDYLGDDVGNAVATTFDTRSEEHTSELQSLMRISYAVFCLKKKIQLHSYRTSKANRHT